MSNVLDTATSWLKQHYSELVLAMGIMSLVGWLFYTHNLNVQAISSLNAANAAEIDKVNRARAEEVIQHQQELQALQSQLAAINARYQDAMASLAAEQAQEEKQIVRKYANDVDGLAQLLANREGFTVVEVTP